MIKVFVAFAALLLGALAAKITGSAAAAVVTWIVVIVVAVNLRNRLT
ncbi:hypothetical protein [Nocardia heshunensis]